MLTILLPAPLWLSLTMVALILCGSVFTVAAYADDIRATRLRQHGLDVPDDPDLGHPDALTGAGRVQSASAGRMSRRAASVRLPDSDG